MTPAITSQDSAERARTIAIDFDGVLMPFLALGPDRELRTDAEPGAGAKAALTRLRENGYRIVIHSSRSWEGYGYRRFVWTAALAEWLDKHGIPYDEIHMDAGKPPAIAYIDDLALRFDGDWKATVDWLLFAR